MYIMGISCFYHDAACALLKDGVLLAAAEEERFTRIKQDPSFPINAIRFCLNHAGIAIEDIDYIGFYEKPLLKLERILSAQMATFPLSYAVFLKAMPHWIKERIWTPLLIERELGYKREVLFIEHHLSHAASAFLVSPFEKAALLTADAVGEWSTTAYGVGEGSRLRLICEMSFPHSLGLLYSAFTLHLGFRIHNDEYKVMGLAAYGDPCLLYTSPSPRDLSTSRMPSSA